MQAAFLEKIRQAWAERGKGTGAERKAPNSSDGEAPAPSSSDGEAPAPSSSEAKDSSQEDTRSSEGDVAATGHSEQGAPSSKADTPASEKEHESTVEASREQPVAVKDAPEPVAVDDARAPQRGESEDLAHRGPPKKAEPDEEELDILQFDSAIYYVEEAEGRLEVDIVRMGRMKGACSCKFHTEDGSGIAGERYEATEGELNFEPGEVYKSLAVPIIDTDKWNTTLEFKIRLTDPQGCELGRYLYICRAKVIDKDCFPTNRFQKEIQEFGPGNLVANGVSDIELLIEYFKLNYSFDGMAWKSWATVGIDLLGNVYYLLTINLLKYVADDVLGPDASAADLLAPGNRELTLVFVGALYLVPYGLLNLLDFWKAQLEIAEGSRAILQENIFRRFMNYDEESRSRVLGSEMGLVMVQDVNDIVDSGYMKMFEVAKNAGKFGVSTYFILGENPEATGPLALSAFAILAFVVLNYRKNVLVNEEVSDMQAEMMEVVQETNQKYRLIADYYMRPQMQDTLAGGIDNLNKATIPLKVSEVTNNYYPGWISAVLVAGYVSIGGEGVLQGSIQIGAFLATINAVKDAGDSFKDIFTALLDVGKAIGPVQKVTELLNLPTNLMNMKATNVKLRDMTRDERQPEKLKRLRETSGQRFGTDAIHIQMKEVSFEYENPNGTKVPVFKNINLSVPQGLCVAIVGSARGGKSTFMKLLGQVLTPTSGIFFVPSYLRILHVSDVPMTLSTSLWNNFAIGKVYWRDWDFETDRILRICKRLGFNSRFLNNLEESKDRFVAGVEDERDLEWQRKLSASDRNLITIARALIYNPEVLVMNRPTAQLSESTAAKVFDLIQEFVSNRGVELPPKDAPKRRPRSAFVSFVRMSGVRIADRIWSIEGGEVSELEKDQMVSVQLN